MEDRGRKTEKVRNWRTEGERQEVGDRGKKT